MTSHGLCQAPGRFSLEEYFEGDEAQCYHRLVRKGQTGKKQQARQVCGRAMHQSDPRRRHWLEPTTVMTPRAISLVIVPQSETLFSG